MGIPPLLTLFPHLRGFHLDAVCVSADHITLDVHAMRRSVPCSLCGRRSKRVQSMYLRTIRDLPCGGLPLTLRVRVRRFICTSGACTRRIFAERFPDLVAPRARQTARFRAALQQVGLALGGKAGARLSGKLALPISGKTLLHLVRQTPLPPIDPPRVVGIDDWAWRRGHRYGTIICDLERRQPKRHGTVLDPWKPYLLRRWAEGCHNGMRLWREIREQGFRYSCTNVARFVAQVRRGEIACPQLDGEATHGVTADTALPRTAVGRPLAPQWSARRIASLMGYRPGKVSDLQADYLVHLCEADEAIGKAYLLTRDFLCMVRERTGKKLEGWIAAAQESDIAELRRYAIGLRADQAAVQAGLTLEGSNGQTEGQVHRLKLLKRQMYGRAGFDLLRRRVLTTA